MKIRMGFVSNSSSSSFVCSVCGVSESGWDACLEDFGWYQCVNGHVLCNNEDLCSDSDVLSAKEQYVAKKKAEFGEDYELTEEEEDEMYDLEYCIPEEACPICRMDIFCDSDLRLYIKKVTGVSEDDAFAEVKQANKRRKKLYDNEYVTFALREKNLRLDEIMKEIRGKFSTYKEFANFIGRNLYWR